METARVIDILKETVSFKPCTSAIKEARFRARRRVRTVYPSSRA